MYPQKKKKIVNHKTRRANIQFMKIAIVFTRSNWCQDTEKMTVHHSRAESC